MGVKNRAYPFLCFSSFLWLSELLRVSLICSRSGRGWERSPVCFRCSALSFVVPRSCSYKSSAFHRHVAAVPSSAGAVAAAVRLAEAIPCPDLAIVAAAASPGPARPHHRWVDLGAVPAASDCSTLKKSQTHTHTPGSVCNSRNAGP